MTDYQLKFIRETLIAAEETKNKMIAAGDFTGAYAWAYGMLAGALRAIEQGVAK